MADKLGFSKSFTFYPVPVPFFDAISELDGEDLADAIAAITNNIEIRENTAPPGMNDPALRAAVVALSALINMGTDFAISHFRKQNKEP